MSADMLASPSPGATALEALERALAALPRVALCERPSTIQHAPRLSAHLGTDVWLKRDDLLGPALGGNKVRKLELLLGEARARGADCVITCGAAQSNHARLTAACAHLAGMEPYLVLRSVKQSFDDTRSVPTSPEGVTRRSSASEPPPMQGNLLLDDLLGAHVQIEPVRRSRDLAGPMDALAARLEREGRRPYVIPVGGSVPLGAAAYAAALLELDEQARERGLPPGTVVHASSSGGTQAGLVVGAAALAAAGRTWRILGVDVDADAEEVQRTVATLAAETAAFLGLPELDTESHVEVLGGYAGAGYGLVSDTDRDAIRLLAQSEGVFADPVYSGKALAGLIGEVRAGHVTGGAGPLIFLHTGGAPALFAYAADL